MSKGYGIVLYRETCTSVLVQQCGLQYIRLRLANSIGKTVTVALCFKLCAVFEMIGGCNRLEILKHDGEICDEAWIGW